LVVVDEKYRDQGLVILGFPCNQFGGQEPGTNEEIKAFAQGKYGVKFPLFSKIDVNGSNAHPLWLYLQTELKGTFVDGIKWNFTKFLIDRSGKPVKRYAPNEDPFTFEDEIQKLLAQPAPQ